MAESTVETHTADRRGQVTALTGLVVQVGLFGGVMAIGMWPEYGSAAVHSLALHLAGGIPIWLIMAVVYGLRRKSRLEDLETEQLRRMQESGLATNLFDVGDESMLLYRRRLNWTYRFVLPLFTVVVAAYLLAVSLSWLWMWRSDGLRLAGDDWSRSSNPFALMLASAGVAVFCFAYSRFVIGMSRSPAWSFLRAGGNYLTGTAISATLAMIALALAQLPSARPWAEPAAATVIMVMMSLLGLETLINFVLDFYRPRHPGEEIRPAFDSRLLSLFSEPGGVMRSIAHTMNYQFGFEVSGTWFYQLIQRSIFPLVTLTVMCLILLSSVVVVDVDERACVERFGRRQEPTLTAGFHLKWPWPVDRVVRHRVDVIRTMVVGTTHEEEDEEDGEKNHDHEALLWGEEHSGSKEMLMIVANPTGRLTVIEDLGESEWGTGAQEKSNRRARSVSVSLLKISLELEYRIKDFIAFEYNYIDPEKVLESVAYEELSTYTAGVSATELMGGGRAEAGRVLRDRLQRRCDEMSLGIELIYASLQEAHPPADREVAKTYQSVVAAEIRKAAEIEKARGEANRILTLTAGSVERAKALDEAIRAMNEVASRTGGEVSAEYAAEAARVDALLFGDASQGIDAASGKVSTALANARADRSAAISRADSKVRSFRNDLVAFRAAPELYMIRRRLQVLRDRLPELRKYVFTSRLDEKVQIQFDAKEQTTLDLSTAQFE